MASGKLNFDVGELRSLAKYMRRQKESRIASINKLDAQVSKIEKSWQGADSKQYAINFRLRILDMKRVVSNYDSVAKTLDFTATLLEKTTNNLSKSKF